MTVIKNAQVYEWKDRHGVQHFFSIDIALFLISKRTKQEVDYHLSLEESKEAARRNALVETFDMEYAMQTDLTKPLIVATIPDMDGTGEARQLLIDGWHRVIKQILTAVDKVPVYILSLEETKACEGRQVGEELVFRPVI